MLGELGDSLTSNCGIGVTTGDTADAHSYHNQEATFFSGWELANESSVQKLAEMRSAPQPSVNRQETTTFLA